MSVRMRERDQVARFRVGQRVTMLGTGEQGVIRTILHFPRAVAYGVDALGGENAGTYSEFELMEVKA
jgi:hypothetical protein